MRLDHVFCLQLLECLVEVCRLRCSNIGLLQKATWSSCQGGWFLQNFPFFVFVSVWYLWSRNFQNWGASYVGMLGLLCSRVGLFYTVTRHLFFNLTHSYLFGWKWSILKGFVPRLGLLVLVFCLPYCTSDKQKVCIRQGVFVECKKILKKLHRGDTGYILWLCLQYYIVSMLRNWEQVLYCRNCW